MFVVRAVKRNRAVSAIVHSNISRNLTNWELSYVGTAEDCYCPSFFEWEGKLIMITHCGGDTSKVKESTDMGKTWMESAGQIAYVWNQLYSKRYFSTATIGDKKVLLFTQLRISREDSKEKYEVYLWFSEGNRVHNVGPILVSEKVIIFGGLFYTKGALFSIHQQHSNEPMSIILTHHRGTLDGIEFVLNTWSANDKYFSRSCKETTPHSVSLTSLCPTPVPTDGLVGFLSGNGNETGWNDEYFYVGAAVKGGTRVKNGFKFAGPGTGATWPVGRQGQTQLYNFTKYGFSVLATVSINEVPRGESPLLTVGGLFGEGLLGLWYNKDRKWQVIFKNAGAPASGWASYESWAKDETYRVALVFHSRRFFVYVDGEHVGGGLQMSAGDGVFDIQRLFIGGYLNGSLNGANATSHVTVTNVFFYNRPFNATEIGSMSRRLTSYLDG